MNTVTFMTGAEKEEIIVEFHKRFRRIGKEPISHGLSQTKHDPLQMVANNVGWEDMSDFEISECGSVARWYEQGIEPCKDRHHFVVKISTQTWEWTD